MQEAIDRPTVTEQRKYSGKVLDIVDYRSPIMSSVCEKFIFDGSIDPYQVTADFFSTITYHGGVGLAANQVGYNFRAFMIMDHKRNASMCFNPSIVQVSEETEKSVEGCISYGDITVPVVRFTEIRLRSQNRDGVFETISLGGLPAIVAQHEMDHLNGINFLTRASRYHRDMAKQRLKIMHRRANKNTSGIT